MWVAALVLAVAGAAKALHPSATQLALRTLKLPSSPALVRAIGLGEVAVAVAAVTGGGRVAPALLAVAYLVLAVVAWRLWRPAAVAGGGGSGRVGCGCFGRSSAPVGPWHVAVDVVAAAVAAGCAVLDVASLPSLLPELPALGAPHALLVARGAAATIASMTVLPETRLAAQRVPARDPRIHLFGPTIGRKPSTAAAPDGAAQEVHP